VSRVLQEGGSASASDASVARAAWTASVRVAEIGEPVSFELRVRLLDGLEPTLAAWPADPLELALPAAGPFVIDDLEGGGRHEVDGRSSAAREAWNAAARRRRSAEDAMFAKARVDVVDLSTEGDVELPFVALFKRRVAGKGGRA
jgi:hypothetical protein